MKTNDALLEKVAEYAGAAIFITGALILGPVGLLLLLGLFYSMMVENLVMGIVTGLLTASPVVSLVVWASLKSASAIQKLHTRKIAPAAHFEPVH